MTDPTDRKALVYKGMPPNHTCCDAALRILRNGEWIVLFMTGGDVEPDPTNHIRLCRSTDEGHTWQAAEMVLSFDDRACLLSEVIVNEGAMRVFAVSHGGRFEDWQNLTITSNDSGRSWGEPEPFVPLPRRTFVRNLCVTSWGEWVVPFQTYDTAHSPSTTTGTT